jgi:hypothetical protein
MRMLFAQVVSKNDQNGAVSNQLTDINPYCERVSVMYFYSISLGLAFHFHCNSIFL